MPASKAEQVLEGIKGSRETVPGATVQRNSVLPKKIPDGGLIILRDGDPGEPEQALGGVGSTYYQHAVEIEEAGAPSEEAGELKGGHFDAYVADLDKVECCGTRLVRRAPQIAS